MATVKKFEDLEIWQIARMLCQFVNRVTEGSPFKKNYGLKYQIQNASGSAMDNIAEGFGRAGKHEFKQFLAITNGSVNEVKSQLYRAFDQKIISEKEFTEGYELADKLSNKTGSFINYLVHTEIKGEKFRADGLSQRTKRLTSNI
jgi:four helix bundle protein